MSNNMEEIGPGFWSFRASFRLYGVIDVGTHMALAKLNSGKFVAIDTCPLGKAQKAKIDELTNNGELLEAVIATHPFHMNSFEQFYKWYPNALFYGTPRHLTSIKTVPWAGSVAEEEVLSKWNDQGLFMSIPAGSEFISPSEANHFISGLFVFHAPSRTLFNDDTIMIYLNPGFILRMLGKRHASLDFWELRAGLKMTKTAPHEFEEFVRKVLKEWDFENLCLAHNGNLVGGGKKALSDLLEREKPKLDQMTTSSQ